VVRIKQNITNNVLGLDGEEKRKGESVLKRMRRREGIRREGKKKMGEE
jgi:hypothetical protein